ncbi:MAG: hypothetical protein ABJI96_23415 [Paracoccaceae bacterium]
MTDKKKTPEQSLGNSVKDRSNVVIDARKEPLSLAALSDKEMIELTRRAEDYKSAQMRFAKAVGVLWNAQTSAARAVGRADFAAELRPLHLWDDCSCC